MNRHLVASIDLVDQAFPYMGLDVKFGALINF